MDCDSHYLTNCFYHWCIFLVGAMEQIFLLYQKESLYFLDNYGLKKTYLQSAYPSERKKSYLTKYYLLHCKNLIFCFMSRKHKNKFIWKSFFHRYRRCASTFKTFVSLILLLFLFRNLAVAKEKLFSKTAYNNSTYMVSEHIKTFCKII